VHPSLAILGYSEAAMFLGRAPRQDVSAIISIHGTREFAVDYSSPYRLDLSFDDVEVPLPDDNDAIVRQYSRERWNRQNGLTEVAPTKADVGAIIRFAEQVRDIDGILLCHCGGGMSRAPAAALICLAVWKGPGLEKECAKAVLQARAGAVPHRGLIRLADELLGRDHKLVDAGAPAAY